MVEFNKGKPGNFRLKRAEGTELKPSDFLPLSQPATLILSCVALEPINGWGIHTRVEELTGGKMEITVATLYENLKWQARNGLVNQVNPPVDILWKDPKGKYYQITELGKNVLLAERERLAVLGSIIDSSIQVQG